MNSSLKDITTYSLGLNLLKDGRIEELTISLKIACRFSLCRLRYQCLLENSIIKDAKRGLIARVPKKMRLLKLMMMLKWKRLTTIVRFIMMILITNVKRPIRKMIYQVNSKTILINRNNLNNNSSNMTLKLNNNSKAIIIF